MQLLDRWSCNFNTSDLHARPEGPAWDEKGRLRQHVTIW